MLFIRGSGVVATIGSVAPKGIERLEQNQMKEGTEIPSGRLKNPFNSFQNFSPQTNYIQSSWLATSTLNESNQDHLSNVMNIENQGPVVSHNTAKENQK